MESAGLNCARCGRPMQIVRYRCERCDLAVEGHFELPALARLSLRQQAFVTAFVRVHGNIKRMGELFEISYPTVKKRLDEITASLDADLAVPEQPHRVLERLERGEIDVEEALDRLSE